MLLAKRVCISRPTVACMIQIRKRGSLTVNSDLWLSYQEVPFLNVHWRRRRGNSQWRLNWQSDKIHTPPPRLSAQDCSLTEGAAFVLCAFHGAIRQHLEVEAVSAVKSCDDALQLGLCRANTGLNAL